VWCTFAQMGIAQACFCLFFGFSAATCGFLSLKTRQEHVQEGELAMAKQRVGLHKALSAILDGARIPEEVRASRRPGSGGQRLAARGVRAKSASGGPRTTLWTEAQPSARGGPSENAPERPGFLSIARVFKRICGHIFHPGPVRRAEQGASSRLLTTRRG
jgi:hypothetical protein